MAAAVKYRLIMVVGLLIAICGYGQDSTTADGLFSMAKKAAFEENDYPNAIRLSKKALVLAPQYADILVFTGRVFMWSGLADSSRGYLDKGASVQPPLEDAFIALSDLELYLKNREAAMAAIERGLAALPENVPLLLKKAGLLVEEKKLAEAEQILQPLSDEGHKEAKQLLRKVKDLQLKNIAGIYYQNVSFSTPLPNWHLVSAHYTRITKWGPLTGRVSLGSRFSHEALQFEAEAYPRLNETFSLYGNIAISDDVRGVFPRSRLGFSLMSTLPEGWEAEVGLRFLKYGSDRTFYTGYVGKYHGRFLTSIRGYIAPEESRSNQSLIVTSRYYTGNIDDHILVQLVFGRSPDERLSFISDNPALNSTGVGGGWKKRFGSRYMLLIDFLYERQNYIAHETTSNWYAGAGINFRF